tara:strand:+ start:815 stop:2515 length:1701 start_codon:yes stop_codon:yes gene_type:complete
MARYDDGGIEFSEQKFAAAREYKEDQAKKQEEFSKELGLGNFLVKAINFGLDKVADNLETSRATQRAHYLTQLENAKEWQTMVQGYAKEGLNRAQMLYREKQKQLTEYIQNEFGTDFDISGYSDAINRIAKEYSDDKVNLESFNKAVDAQLAIPNLSEEDMITLIKQEGAAPRNIFSFLGNSMIKLAKSHDKETLSAADKEAKDRMIGGLLGEQFEASKKALENYAAKGNPIEKIVDFMKSDEGKAIKVFKGAQQQIVKRREVDKFGNLLEVEYIGNYGTRRDGSPVQIGELVAASQSKSATPAIRYTENEIDTVADQIDRYVTTSGNVDLENAYEEYIDDKNGRGLAHNVLTTSRNLEQQFDIPASKAIGLATKHILQQDGEILDTRVSLYDYDKLEGVIDTEKINKYIKSIKLTKSEKAEQDIGNMYDDFVNGLKQSDLSEDEKVGELNELNKIVSPYIAIIDIEHRRKTPKDIDKEVEEKEPLSIEEMISKYKINEEFINTLKTIKPKRGSVTQNSPIKKDPIDMITDQMLYDLGYITKGKDSPFLKMRARRKFLIDFYNDLG